MNYEINTKIDLENFVTHNWNEINKYIDSKMEGLPLPIYNSVDIRESKNKFAPIDNNIYPAGFNNICLLDLESVSTHIEKFIKKENSSSNVIGIICESHTKNTFYLDHLALLKKAILDAGFDQVKVISFDNNLFGEEEVLNLVSASKFDLQVEKAQILDGKIQTQSGAIDFAVLNNDQSAPIELEWDQISTPIHPTPKIGWYARSKSGHFIEYHKVVEDFCNNYSINPNLLEAKFEVVDGVDFSQKEGLEKIGSVVDNIKGSDQDMKVFIKGDQGTYGMGISVVGSGEEAISLNRKARNKMDIGKNKIKFTSVIVQEGVDTILKYDEMPAEVTIYLIGGKSVGGFMRANSQKGAHENLNSKGMVFKKFCISEIRQDQDHKAKEALYSVIARLSSLASAMEIKAKS